MVLRRRIRLLLAVNHAFGLFHSLLVPHELLVQAADLLTGVGAPARVGRRPNAAAASIHFF